MTFDPHPWLAHPHLQTLAGALYRPIPRFRTWREWVETPDGDRLALDWLDRDAALTVLVLHGLSGSAASPVVRGVMAAASQVPARVVGLNFRGSLGTPNQPRLYHAGRTDDLDLVVRHLLALYPGPLAIVGLSLGGNILLKWMGERDVSERVTGCAVCVPYNLGNCARRLEEDPVSRIYRYYMVGRLKARVLEMLTRFPGVLDPAVVRGVRTLTDFDDRVTAPLNGFRDAEDYWGQSSSLHYLKGIRRPALLINAVDDPFLRVSDLPVDEVRANPCLELQLTDRGGHLGYIGPGWRPWIEGRVAAHLRSATGV